jgi:hypothetical protein
MPSYNNGASTEDKYVLEKGKRLANLTSEPSPSGSQHG